MKWFVSTLLLLFSLLILNTTPLQASERSDKYPNVILILADDLAPGDLAGGEGNPTRTPRLDQFAEQSVVFPSAYSASCVCAPARAALLTGRYPHRTGVVTLNMKRFPQWTRLKRDEMTIANYYKAAGYATALVGKWHVGQGEGYHPLDRGFDHFWGIQGSDNVGYFRYPFYEDREHTLYKQEYLTDRLTRHAIEFVRKHQDRPFFLHLAHYAPHRPLQAPEADINKYLQQGFSKDVATIYAMIEIMDRGIGQLLDELQRLNLEQSTIVLFMSDNGPDPLTDSRFNHALRGTKYEIYEGGIRVPLMIRWSGTLKPGTRSQTVTGIDILPTLMELSQISIPPAPTIDGLSFAKVLNDPQAEFSPTRFWQWNRGKPNYTHNAAIRSGEFKLVRPFVTRGIDVEDSSLPAQLYHLSNDPAETINLAEQYPQRSAELLRQLQEWTISIERDRQRPVQIGEKTP